MAKNGEMVLKKQGTVIVGQGHCANLHNVLAYYTMHSVIHYRQYFEPQWQWLLMVYCICESLIRVVFSVNHVVKRIK